MLCSCGNTDIPTASGSPAPEEKLTAVTTVPDRTESLKTDRTENKTQKPATATVATQKTVTSAAKKTTTAQKATTTEKKKTTTTTTTAKAADKYEPTGLEASFNRFRMGVPTEADVKAIEKTLNDYYMSYNGRSWTMYFKIECDNYTWHVGDYEATSWTIWALNSTE